MSSKNYYDKYFQEIPTDLIQQVVPEFKDGTKAQLDTRELEHPSHSQQNLGTTNQSIPKCKSSYYCC